FGHVVGISPFPSLNNDVGDRLVLNDREGSIIDAVTFSDRSYQDKAKEDGGWSLERSDTQFKCEDAGNWRASEDPKKGTPGKMNSISGHHIDDTPPRLDYGFISSPNTIRLQFTTTVDTQTVQPIMAARVLERETEKTPASAHWMSDMELELQFDTLSDKTVYRIVLNPLLTDCPGNAADSSHYIEAGSMRMPLVGDLVINELLFDAGPEQEDFLEIINRSDDIIDLSGLKVAETPFDATSNTEGPYTVVSVHRPLFPKQVIAFSSDPDHLKATFRASERDNMLMASPFPEFNISEGAVNLISNLDSLLDRFPYQETMHHPLLLSTQGVSLERISLDGNSEFSGSWHSAAEDAGFATPGRWNSQAIDATADGSEIVIDPWVISPDNDGRDDLLSIHYRFSESGTVASVRIYSESGHLVKKLMDSDLVGTTGLVCWDGLDASGLPVPQGRYIV
ncbi:MAG: hypothetical protein ACKO7B_14160, partial [Flavobacteriales bacterium]